MSDLAILVVSCDKNEWLLDLFFEKFSMFWKNCSYNVYLSIEQKAYKSDSVELTVINNFKGDSWCNRVKKCIEKIPEEYLLIILDDYIIEEPVRENLLEEYMMYLENEDIYNIILSPMPNEKHEIHSKYEKLYHRSRFGRYKTSLQCGIWNKRVLYKLLSDKENAWEFEIFGNIRTFILKNSFYVVKREEYKPIIYNDGFFVVQGRVNLPEKKRLECKFGHEMIIPNVAVFENDIIRDDIKFVPRVIRRIKIICMFCLYKFRFCLFGDEKV